MEGDCIHSTQKNFYSNNKMNKFSSGIKTYRMQQLYKAVLNSLVDAQKSRALNGIRLQLGKKEKIVNLKIPIMFIIGDNQGGDGLAGHVCHCGKMAKIISRTCDAGPYEVKHPKLDAAKG